LIKMLIPVAIPKDGFQVNIDAHISQSSPTLPEESLQEFEVN
jgi:hypothetical protein